MSNFTIILPCAGEATRLSLPYSKEILSIEKNKSLIDYTFDLFSEYGRKDVDFVITINDKKTDLVKHLSKYRDRFNISFTYFNPREEEYTGSIKSARHLFGEKNIVLLPDTFLKMRKDGRILECIEEGLKETGFSFLFKREKDPEMLKTKGSLLVDELGLILNYEDKPCENLESFNSFWCSFAFKKRAFDSSIEFMEKSTLKHRFHIDEIKKTPLYGSKGMEVDDYYDLGTWDQIYKFISSEGWRRK